MKNILQPLQKCLLFKNKSSKDIESILSKIRFEIVSFEKSETIFSPFQEADKIGIVLSGEVFIQKLFPEGRIVIIDKKTCSDLIAQASVFSRLDNYPTTMMGNQPGEILLISKTYLLELFKSDTAIMLNFLESISNYALVLKHKIGILSLGSIQEKIAGYLIYYQINRHDHPQKEISNTMHLPFSKKSWAEYMNVSRTSLSRELKSMEIQGLISLDKNSIKIHNWDKIKQILSLA